MATDEPLSSVARVRGLESSAAAPRKLLLELAARTNEILPPASILLLANDDEQAFSILATRSTVAEVRDEIG